MRIALAFLVACSLLSATAARAQQPLVTPAEIDKACDATERRAAKHKDHAWIFGEVADEPHALASWRTFSSTSALEHATPDGPPESQAFVSSPAGGLVFVELFLTSPSGDWAQFADLCYRPDGTLARAVDTLNTFHGDDDDGPGVSRVHTTHFDVGGKIVSKRSKLLDLQTRKPVKRSFMDQKDRIFLRVKDLPFSDLLSMSAQ
ncbi:MAG TPA: hypothetical protein VKQ32_15630 [Polyangia bacterium]|nr:hypothetical protein [Polyangia bacterium]